MMNAQEHLKARQDSIERSDTDGFVSQWAHGIMASLRTLEEELKNNGNMAEFRGLYHRESGLRVRAKQVKVYNEYKHRSEMVWCVLNENNKAVAWCPVYYHEDLNFNSKRTKLWKLGFEQRAEMAPCKAELYGNNAAAVRVIVGRTDKGYPMDAVPADDHRINFK